MLLFLLHPFIVGNVTWVGHWINFRLVEPHRRSIGAPLK
jgi:hypothetical protein